MAVDPFKKALNKIDIKDPVVSVYSNIDGKKYRDAQDIRRQLPKQVYIRFYYRYIINIFNFICFLLYMQLLMYF